MVLILFASTILAFLAVDAFRRAPAAAVAASDRAPSGRTLDRLFHVGHTWAQIRDSQSVTVGVDDFAQRFLGKVDRVRVRRSHARVRQGDWLATMEHKGRRLNLVAPVSGILTETNSSLTENPGVVNTSPYGQGWLAKIKPSGLEVEIRNLLRGAVADRWREDQQAQVATCFAPQLGTVLPDGGQWVADASDLLSDADWERLSGSFFPLLPSDQSNHELID